MDDRLIAFEVRSCRFEEEGESVELFIFVFSFLFFFLNSKVCCEIMKMFSTFLFFSFFFITTTHSSAIIHRISSPNQLHKNHTRFPVVVSISLPSPPRNDIHTHSFGLLQIWHGLSDSYENPALGSLAKQINLRYPGTPVYMIRLDQSGSQDRYEHSLYNIPQLSSNHMLLIIVALPGLVRRMNRLSMSSNPPSQDEELDLTLITTQIP